MGLFNGKYGEEQKWKPKNSGFLNTDGSRIPGPHASDADTRTGLFTWKNIPISRKCGAALSAELASCVKAMGSQIVTEPLTFT